MDDRELNFSKSEDEQSEMSNHDFEQDIKPVKKLFDRMGKRERKRDIVTSLSCNYNNRKQRKCIPMIVCGSHYRSVSMI